MAKIDGVEYLPEWFSLQKYQGCESFAAVDGYNCLVVRKGALCILRLVTERGFTVEEFYASEDCRPHELMRSDPLNWNSVRAIHWGEKEEGNILPDTPVRPLEFVDLLLQRQGDEEDEHEGRPNRRVESWNLFDNHDWSAIMEDLNGIAVGAVDGCMETIKVDMEATDAVLIEAFAAWLKGARKKQPNNTSKRERPAYRDWARYGLLPYLDLLIWAMETGNQIPHHVMAQAVGYSKGGDSFRKTVPKLADELMRNLAELEALAAIEAPPEKLEA